MRVFHVGEAYDLGASAVALGNFDGLHLAHREIIRKCVEYAAKNGLRSGILLFENHTGTVTAHTEIKVLTTLPEKLELLQDMGLDFAAVIPFDESFRHLEPEGFIDFLQGRLAMRAASVGYDYSFGYRAQGDVRLLQKLAAEKRFHVIETPAVRYEGTIVSSTLVRDLLVQGNVREANALLGRPYKLSGTVDAGLQNGRKMGLPTANLSFDRQKLLPGDGVYKGRTYIRGAGHLSLINVGKNPTFRAKKRTVESFILDFDEDIYDAGITIAFDEKIRDEIRFENQDQLKKQIHQDINQVKGAIET